MVPYGTVECLAVELIWPVNEEIRHALEQGMTVDITTTGRKTGLPRRIEVTFHNLDGRIFISGHPGARDWLANLLAQPEFTFHLKGAVEADLPAVARSVTDPNERRAVLTRVAEVWGNMDVKRMVESSPLIEVTLSTEAAA